MDRLLNIAMLNMGVGDGSISLVLIGLAAVALILLIVIICTSYVKAPPNKAYIITGLKKKPKILIGKAGLKLPFLERKDELLIEQLSIDIKTGDYVPTSDFIGVNIDAVAKVQIRTDEEGIKLAMKNFLNMNSTQINAQLVDSLQGNMREIIGTITLKELCNDRKSFGDQVQEKAQVDMNNLGIQIISCNIQHVEDKNDLITALGQDNMATIQKTASIAKANAERDVAIAQAQAAKDANDAKVASETEIAIKQNDLAIKKSELQVVQDTKKAEADAAYRIQEQAQRKSIEVANTEADIAKQEKEIELKMKEAQVREQALDADIKKAADAEKYRQQQMAEVELYKRQKEAEAKKYELAQQAEAKKIQAEAVKYELAQQAEAKKIQADALLVEMQREAEGIRAKGEAEADAIRAKAEAEAIGIDKKAEAMQKYGEAAVIEMLCKMYPLVAEAIAKPLANIDSITMYGEGNTAKMTEDVTKSFKQTIDGIGDSLGINFGALLGGFAGTKFASMKPAGDEGDQAKLEVKASAPVATKSDDEE
ncbi:flotillin [Oscillospiraceae bacterium]|nr:flotillin [Oscillospiraceae bacterium]